MQVERPSRTTLIIKVETRWPAKQIGEKELEIRVPLGDGPPIINPAFAGEAELTEKEYYSAEYQAIKALAVRVD